MWRRRFTAVGVAICCALIGFFVWVTGLRGLANRAESLCWADLDRRTTYGGYRMSARMSARLWPPSFECNLIGNGVDPLPVSHPIQAIAWFGWVAVTPVVSGITLLALGLGRRRPRAAGA